MKLYLDGYSVSGTAYIVIYKEDIHLVGDTIFYLNPVKYLLTLRLYLTGKTNG